MRTVGFMTKELGETAIEGQGPTRCTRLALAGAVIRERWALCSPCCAQAQGALFGAPIRRMRCSHARPSSAAGTYLCLGAQSWPVQRCFSAKRLADAFCGSPCESTTAHR